MAVYQRQSTFADGDTIYASLLNNEYNALEAAFNVSSGHTHDGSTAGDGGPISKLFSNAITFGTNVNSDVVVTFDATSNDGVLTWMEDEDYFKFSDDILVDSAEKVLFRDSAIYIHSSADGQLDLVADTEIQITATTVDLNGNLDVSGTLKIGSGSTVSDIKDEDNMSSDSATALATQQSIKAYVDAVTTSLNQQDLDLQGDSGGALTVDLDTQTLTIAGGTGIDSVGSGQTVTLNIDSSVATLTGSQTLASKTLTSPVLNTGVSGSAFLDEDNMASDSATKVASQQSIKAYVDTQVATIPVGDITAVVAGTGLSGGGTTGSVTLNADVSASSTNTFTNKTIDADGTGNSITNIEDANIKAAAAIDATKIADGSVTSAEFQYINSLSSNAQDQINLKAPLASPALTGNPTAPTQSAGDNSTKLATTAYVDNSQAARDQLSEMTDVTLASLADANYFIYDNAASVWKNKAISGAITSDKDGVTTLASGIDATKIADGSVTSTEFQYINSLSSNAQTQLDAKQATIDSSSRLNANLVGDGSVDNTEYGYLNGVTSGIQTQIDAKASAGFAVAMAIAL